MLLVLNLPLIGLWVKLLTVPRPWLYGGILLFATLGTIGEPFAVRAGDADPVRGDGLRDAASAIRSRRSWSG
jgi:hypothetical protein